MGCVLAERLMRLEMPYAAPDQVVGLLGGSFDPPHGGHVHITQAAMKRFCLDRVWWLVSPGNPLKERGPAPFAERVHAGRAIMRHPRVAVTDFEAQVGTRYTAETLRALIAHFPKVRFVWLMGADNLVQFDQWQDWRWIMETVPVGVLARPGDRMAARTSKAARIYAGARLKGREARLLGQSQAPAWAFQNMPMRDVSSSAIRARGEWG